LWMVTVGAMSSLVMRHSMFSPRTGVSSNESLFAMDVVFGEPSMSERAIDARPSCSHASAPPTPRRLHWP
jgi:hypothetical protein